MIPGPRSPHPAWREGEADWVAHEDQFDASLSPVTRSTRTCAPGSSSLSPIVADEEILDESPRPEPVRALRTRRTHREDLLSGRAVRQGSSRSVSVATFTGIVLAVVVLGDLLPRRGTYRVLVMVRRSRSPRARPSRAFARWVRIPATILGSGGGRDTGRRGLREGLRSPWAW